MSDLYQFAEPQRECRFYPRKSTETSTDILARAASWYGGKVVRVIEGEILPGDHLAIPFSRAALPPAEPEG